MAVGSEPGDNDGDGRLAPWALAVWLAFPWQRLWAGRASGCGLDGLWQLAHTGGVVRSGVAVCTLLVVHGLPVGRSSHAVEKASAAAAVAAAGEEAVGALDVDTGDWGSHQHAHLRHTEVAFLTGTPGVHH